MNAPLGSYLWPSTKTVTGVVTKSPSDGSGYFEAYLSTWDVDRDGERFAKGAFLDSILEWMAAGDMPPVVWNHRSDEPESLLGRVLWMKEDARGLLVGAQLDLSHPRSQIVYEALLTGRLNTMSISFISDRTHMEGAVRVFDRAEVLEATLTPTPANPHARVTTVKNEARLAYNDPRRYSKILDRLEGGDESGASDRVDDFVVETRAIMARERAEADARARRAAAQVASELQVTTDNTSGERFYEMLFPAAVREQRDEAVDVDV
jgi:HK97 family phage prohead protease